MAKKELQVSAIENGTVIDHSTIRQDWRLVWQSVSRRRFILWLHVLSAWQY